MTMTEEIEVLDAVSESERDAIERALDAAGVEYDVYRVYRYEVPQNTTQTDSTTPGGGSVGLPAESTRQYATAELIANHDKEWVNPTEIQDVYDAAGAAHSDCANLHDRGVCDRRNAGQGGDPVEYRVKDLYRQELLAEGERWIGEVTV